MRNDVSIPPDESELLERPVIIQPVMREISHAPIPPPESLKADVQLFDHPNFEPSGAGNFWLLGIIGLGIAAMMIMLFWFVHGLMK
jgi:hypothetical protein